MITYVLGDLFQSPARVLVNAVNTVGVMGAGIAAHFKGHFPEMFEQYAALCKSNQFKVGNLWMYKTPHKWVLNFPTKRHWRSPSRVEDIEAGLQKFVTTYAERGITSVSFPLLGSGLGGLSWDGDVRPLMEAYLGSLPLSVYIHRYETDDPFKSRRAHPLAIRRWLNSQPQTVSFIKFWRDLVRLVKEQSRFKTLDDAAGFRVMVDDGKRRSVSIYPDQGDSLFVPETMLSDLWTYIHSAGYVMPHNLPGGLDVYAPYLFALFTGLDYIRPVLLSFDDQQRHIGLHLVPPIDRKAESSTYKVKI
jgi:O-acetyl-ADP-ribose deacetylase (regulator of RNase III)